MEESSSEERRSFRIVDVHLSDEFTFFKKTLFRAGEEIDEAGGGQEELQMSKLGLPTSFISAPRRSPVRLRGHRKSLFHDQVTPSLVSVNTTVEKPPFLVDSLQVSIGSVVSNDQANRSAVANSLASLDGEASALSCEVTVTTSAPVQRCEEVAGNFVSALGALLLNREPTGSERPKMSNIVMAESVEVIDANSYNVSDDQEEDLGKDDCTIPSGKASFVDEGNQAMNSASLSVIDLSSLDDSARCEGVGRRVDDILAAVVEPESLAEDSQISDIGGSKWSACLDPYYGRYYFYNAETRESTWQAPEGFEINSSAPFVQGNDEDSVTEDILTDSMAEEKEVFLENDIQAVLLLQVSGAEGMFRRSKDDGSAERVGGLLTDLNNVALLVDAPSCATDVGLEEIEGEERMTTNQSSLLLVEAGAIAESASCPQKAMKIDNVQVKEIEPSKQGTSRIDPKSACLGDLKWSVCWDNYYGRCYFHNAETLESTWEPPEGFESYAYNESNEMPDSEALLSKENKAGSNLEDSFDTGSLQQVVEIMSSSMDAKHQELCRAMECEEQVVFDSEDPTCQEVSTATTEGDIGHRDLVKCKVNVISKRAKKAAHFFGQHLDAAATSSTLHKYWLQRFNLFSKYESGIKLDEEGWFSVTPEAIAKHQAARCKGYVIVDAFTGVGGNAIQFALAGHHVVAIDNDRMRLEYAHNNAMVYGVADRIDFVLGDFFTVLSSMKADVVFLSPPWGGPDYLDAAVYDILTMLQPKDGVTLLNVARLVAPNIILFLPRNVDINQLAELSKALSFSSSCEVERNFLNGKLKAITAYYGQFENMEECHK